MPTADFDGTDHNGKTHAESRRDLQDPDAMQLTDTPLPSVGAEDARAEIAAVPTPERTSETEAHTVALTREAPFGITAIVGGTNVRFSLSAPGRSEPLVISSITWEQLREIVTPNLEGKGIAFEDAKDLVLSEIAKHFADFVKEQFPKDGPPPPFQNICAFDLSVAGPVTGRDINALVTPSNTGVNLKGEPLALDLLRAINHELSSRGCPTIPHASTAVLNDATAALLGEYAAGQLQGIANGGIKIVGTGLGGQALVDGEPSAEFAEFGHTVIETFDRFRKAFIVRNAADMSDLFDEKGGFKELDDERTYIEHRLAGPWFAINFVRKLAQDDKLRSVLRTLAEKIQGEMPKDYEGDLYNDLVGLQRLSHEKRSRWAMESSSALIKAIISYILIPDPEKAWIATPPNGVTDEWLAHADAEQVLNYYAWVENWKLYFQEMGDAIGAISQRMKEKGTPLQKMVLVGGVAEACQKYLSPSLRAEALRLIHLNEHLPKGTVVFSTMTPEARESAFTQARVNQVHAYWQENGEWESFSQET